MTGRLSLCFYTISGRCQGWRYNYSLFKKSSFCFTRIFRSHSNGFLWLVSYRCRPVLYLPLKFSIFFLSKHALKIEFVNRFEELREALEKLQLNDAALKVDFLTFHAAIIHYICMNALCFLELGTHLFHYSRYCEIDLNSS